MAQEPHGGVGQACGSSQNRTPQKPGKRPLPRPAQRSGDRNGVYPGTTSHSGRACGRPARSMHASVVLAVTSRGISPGSRVGSG